MDSDGARPTSDSGNPGEKGKGKGKAPVRQMPTAPDETREARTDNGAPTGGESIAPRLLKSTTALAHDLVMGPAAYADIGHQLPGGKAGPSNGTPALSGSTARSPIPQPVNRALDTPFKSAHVDDHIAQQEAAFSGFMNGTSVPELSPVFAAHPTSTSESWQRTPETGREPHVSQYAQSDGLDVVRLLDGGYDEVARPEPEMPLTTDEATALRKALFPDGDPRGEGHLNIDWDHALNFIPRDSGRLQEHLGVSDDTEARSLWLGQWQNVLSSYTAEVWGDLGSLVEEAQKEMEQEAARPQGTAPSEMKAIGRLRQVLAHIRGS